MRAIVSRIRREDGVMLMELTIAMSVLAVALFALMATYTSGYVAINRASITGTASTLADSAMETYRGKRYADITPGTTTTTYTRTSNPPSPDGRTYVVTATVTPATAVNTSGTSARSVKRVSIVVTDASGRTWARAQSILDELAS